MNTEIRSFTELFILQTNPLLHLFFPHSDTHLARGGVDELGASVHRPRQHQGAVLVARQGGKRPLVSVLTY